MTILRAIIAFIGFLGALFWVWYIPVICIVLLSLRFRSWEAIALGVFMDLLWLAPGAGYLGLPLFTIFAIAVVWVFEPVRSEFIS